MATNSNQQPNPIATIRSDLERMTSQFAMVMPAEVVERFKRVLITSLAEHPELQRCTPRSIIQCAMRAAQDGLDLDGREAAIVPFRDGAEMKGQYVPMVMGIRKKVRQTGLVSDWMVHVVHEGDEFDIQLGDRPHIHHKPGMKGGRTRPVLCAYSIATYKDGSISREFMTIDEIEDIRSKSKSNRGPWADPIFYPEMCRKTIARLHAKQLPQSSDLVAMFAREDEEAAGSLPPPSSPPPLRINSVAGTLDEFGSGHMPLAAPGHDDPPGLQESGPPMEDPDQTPEGFHGGPDAPDPIENAYERGREQKKKGHSNKAIPPEYRDAAHTREALAWQAGWSGQPMPTWNQENASPPAS